MLPALSLLLVLLVSLLITRVATVALTATGMTRESARFQARSAFSGVGFTTSEAESVVTHPARRRIVLSLMLFGNVGIVTAISALLLSFAGVEGNAPQAVENLAILVAGVFGVWLLARSQWVDRHLSRIIRWGLRRYTHIDVRDYAGLLHLRDDYGVAELIVEAEDWLDGKTLREAPLRHEGMLVLGVEAAGGHYLGAPDPDMKIRAGDTLLVYGRRARMEELAERARGMQGDLEHLASAEEQARIAADERARAGR